MSGAGGENANVVVMASAGTGKTFGLTNRFIALLAQGARPESILATTFTRKAAGEILDRVLSRLADAAGGGKALDELREHADPSLTQEGCSRLLTLVARNLHTLGVMTIDAVLVRFASALMLELDAPASWRLIDDEADARIRAESVTEALDTGERAELIALLEMLHSGQTVRGVHASALACVDSAYGSYLQTADRPGLWERLPGAPAKLLDAESLRGAAKALAQVPMPLTAKGQPHGTWAKAHATATAALDEADWERFLEGGIAKAITCEKETFARVAIPDGITEAYRPIIDHAAGVVLGQFHRRNIATRGLLARFHTAYTRRKAQLAAMRFEDVPRLLLSQPFEGVLDHLYFRLDSRVEHLLLDEFQDTSITQLKLLSPIIDEIMADPSSGRSVYCVGDVKQSLYTWREAEPELLPAMPGRWPGFDTRSLDSSWRSSPEVLHAVNEVFSRLTENDAVRESAAAAVWEGRFHEHASARPERPGASRLMVVEPGEGEEKGESRFRLASRRVASILKRCPEAEIGVLVRQRACIPPLLQAIRGRGIAAGEVGGNPLTDSAPVAAAVSLLWMADFPGDTGAAHHVATSPLGEALHMLDSRDEKRVRRVAAELRQRFMHEGYAAVFRDLRRRCAHAMKPWGHARFGQLIDLAQRYDASGEEGGSPRPSRLARIIRSRRVEDPGQHRVRVMTIHASKGLEFDAVILPDLEGEYRVIPPAILTQRDDPLGEITGVTNYPGELLRRLDPRLESCHAHARDRAISEGLSTLYVAMTRAINILEMIIEAPKGTSAKTSSAGVLFEALAQPHFPGRKVWSVKRGNWAADIRSRRMAPPAADDTALPIRLAPRQNPAAARLARRSPSAIAGSDRTIGMLLGASGARQTGSVVHALFEHVGWMDDGGPTREELEAALAALGVPTAEVEGHVSAFETALSKVKGALSRGAYADRPGELSLRREWPFALREADSVLAGRFDRVVVGSDAGGRALWADVVDFKTDSLEPGKPTDEHATSHAAQMNAYRRAAGRLLGLGVDRISARLIFTRSGDVVETRAE